MKMSQQFMVPKAFVAWSLCKPQTEEPQREWKRFSDKNLAQQELRCITADRKTTCLPTKEINEAKVKNEYFNREYFKEN